MLDLTKIGFLAIALTFPQLAQAGEIAVVGEAEVAVAPDLARITLGVSQVAPSAQDAMSQTSIAVADVLAALSDAGIPTGDVMTSQLQLYPQQTYDQATQRSVVTGYQASNTVIVTVQDLTALGGILDAVVRSGANEMRGLQFDVSDRRPHLNEARRLAVADGREKAALYAAAAGVALGPLQSLSETGQMAAPMMMESMARQSGDVPIAIGEMTISASISMSYEISE